MLRYKTETRPGLVALYDIWPGNRAGPFLQPWSPHGAIHRSVIGSVKKGIYINSVPMLQTYPTFLQRLVSWGLTSVARVWRYKNLIITITIIKGTFSRNRSHRATKKIKVCWRNLSL